MSTAQATSASVASPASEREETTTQSSGGAAGAVRGGLRGLDFEGQVQRLAPRSVVQRETPTADAGPGSDPTAWLLSKWQSGTEEFGKAIAQVSPAQVAAALPSMSGALTWLLDHYWPSGSGWGAYLKAKGEGTIAGSDAGFPCDIDLEGEGGVELSLARTGGVVTFKVKATAEGGGDVIPTVKAVELPCGAVAEGCEEMSLAIDLGAVTWPTSAWAKLSTGDFKGAMSELLGSAVSIGKNATVTTVLSAKLAEGVGVRGDVVAANATAKLLVGAGLKATHVASNIDKPGSLEVEGDLGIFATLEAEAIKGSGLEQARDFASWLTGLDLSKMGDNEAKGGGLLRMSAKVSLAPSNKWALPQLTNIKFSLVGQLAAMVLGTGIDDAEASVSLVLTPGQFEAMKKSIAQGSAKQGAGTPGAAPAPSAADTGRAALAMFTIEHKYQGTLKLGTLAPLFPGIMKDTGLDLGTQANAEVGFEVACSFKSAELEPIAKSLGASGAKILAAIQARDIFGAIRALLALKTDADAELAAYLATSLDSLKVSVKAGVEKNVSNATAGQGTVSGVAGEASAGVFESFEKEYTAAQLGVPSVVKFLRDLI